MIRSREEKRKARRNTLGRCKDRQSERGGN